MQRMMMLKRVVLALVVLAAPVTMLVSGCDEGDPCDGMTRCQAEGALPFKSLAEYDFFVGPMVELRPKTGVVPYTVAAPLWSDQAGKDRFIVLPEGGKIEMRSDDGEWGFPEGTILVKNFFFDHDRRDPKAGAKIIETRLLLREAGNWRAFTYVWNDAQTEATLLRTGKRVNIEFTDVDGAARTEEYIVPNDDQCSSCHERDDVEHALGLITPQMNRMVERDGKQVAQLTWLAEQGMFTAPPADLATLPAFIDPYGGEGTLDQRARGYLHGNCAHCHQAGGGAGKSGLVFLASEPDLAKVGVCKVPAAAGAGTGGHAHDIVPGKPDESIVVFRMNSLDPEIKMPELPNRVIDQGGLALIREWIAAMPVDVACQ
ncbi:MAG TPA: SO2930 family diheme c-type cytochrome [Nannocystis sp.]